MAISTDADFEQQADDDLSWRRIEISSLIAQLRAAETQSRTSPMSRVLARATVSMLYAHWEGYSKELLETYLRLILKRRPRLRDANEALVFSHALHAVKRSESADRDGREDLVSLFRGEMDGRLRLQRTNMVNTESNLRFRVLRSMLDGFGISIDSFDTKQNLIDVVLCDRRNEIAHGRANFPSVGEVIELRDDVLSMMELLRDLVVAAVVRKQYRRDSSA